MFVHTKLYGKETSGMWRTNDVCFHHNESVGMHHGKQWETIWVYKREKQKFIRLKSVMFRHEDKKLTEGFTHTSLCEWCMWACVCLRWRWESASCSAADYQPTNMSSDVCRLKLLALDAAAESKETFSFKVHSQVNNQEFKKAEWNNWMKRRHAHCKKITEQVVITWCHFCLFVKVKTWRNNVILQKYFVIISDSTIISAASNSGDWKVNGNKRKSVFHP